MAYQETPYIDYVREEASHNNGDFHPMSVSYYQQHVLERRMNPKEIVETYIPLLKFGKHLNRESRLKTYHARNNVFDNLLTLIQLMEDYDERKANEMRTFANEFSVEYIDPISY